MSPATREWLIGLSKLTITVTPIPTLKRGETTRLDGQKDMPTVLRVMRYAVDVEIVVPAGRIVSSNHVDAGVEESLVQALPLLVASVLPLAFGPSSTSSTLENLSSVHLQVFEWLAGQLAVDSLIVPSGGAA